MAKYRTFIGVAALLALASLAFIGGMWFMEARFMTSCQTSVRTIAHPGGDDPPYTDQELVDNRKWCEAEANYVFRYRPSPHKQDFFFGIGAKP
jgi:hypothetical protein